MSKQQEEMLTKELDTLENAISDKNHALAVCAREEIWKIVDRITSLAVAQREKDIVEMIDKMKESLADLEHKRWAKWQSFLHSNLQYEERNFGSNTVAYYILDAGKYEHWSRQIDTPYSKLSEKEKDSDRIEAQKTIEHIINLITKPNDKPNN